LLACIEVANRAAAADVTVWIHGRDDAERRADNIRGTALKCWREPPGRSRSGDFLHPLRANSGDASVPGFRGAYFWSGAAKDQLAQPLRGLEAETCRSFRHGGTAEKKTIIASESAGAERPPQVQVLNKEAALPRIDRTAHIVAQQMKILKDGACASHMEVVPSGWERISAGLVEWPDKA
jgi:hypothetical protein